MSKSNLRLYQRLKIVKSSWGSLCAQYCHAVTLHDNIVQVEPLEKTQSMLPGVHGSLLCPVYLDSKGFQA